MATRTDIDGFLRNDDDNLSARVSDWISKLTDADLPGLARVSRKPAGILSEETIGELAITTIPTSAAVLVEEIREVIRGRLGPQPDGGSVRVRISKTRQRSSPDVDMQRRLCVASDVEGDVNAAFLRAQYERVVSENAELRRQNVELVKCNTTVVGSQMALSAEQSKTIAALGTTRAVVTASNDMSGITTFLGLLTFYFFWPQLKVAMGLNPGASVKDVIDAGKRMMAGEQPPLLVDKPPKPPDSARRIQQAPDVPAPAAELPKPESADDFVARLRNDPEFRRDCASRIMPDTALLAELSAAAQEIG